MLIAVAVLVACQPAKKAASPPPPPPPAVPTPPVANFYDDFPDPFVLGNGPSGHLAASTNDVDLVRMPTVAATDLGSWSKAPDLLQDEPTWAGDAAGIWWAPAVWDAPVGGYVLYYTVRHKPSGKQCIGGATASAPGGPYTVTGSFDSAPFVCQTSMGGSIDPSVFVDPGGQWLLWKSDDNSNGNLPHIWTQQLSDDGTDLEGSRTTLIGVSQAWEFGTNAHNTTVEGPSMVKVGSDHYLFYSGSDWESVSYAVGYAKCTSPSGGCTKPQDGPVLASGSNGSGPGGGEVFVDHGGQRWLAYHAWNPGKPIGYPNSGPKGERRLHLTKLGLAGGPPSFGSGP